MHTLEVRNANVYYNDTVIGVIRLMRFPPYLYIEFFGAVYDLPEMPRALYDWLHPREAINDDFSCTRTFGEK